MALNLKSLFSLLDSNPSEQDCINYLEKTVWKGRPPTSPFDPTSQVYPCANNKWRCKNTGKYFTARSLTIFRNSNLSLKKWFLILSLFVSRKKGISSPQLAREVCVSQKTAWFALQRLREAFNNPIFKNRLEGIVEIDETFIGGKNKNRHWDKKIPHSQGRNWKDKIPVWGGIERKTSNLIAQVVPNTQQNTLVSIIRTNIKENSTIYSDEWYRHSDLYKDFNHQWINHSAKQYVNGDVSTNTIENPWSHLKRMIYGTYHWISKKHPQKYVDEFTFRFNTRNRSEQERFDLALLASVGKSLTYNQLINC